MEMIYITRVICEHLNSTTRNHYITIYILMLQSIPSDWYET